VLGDCERDDSVMSLSPSPPPDVSTTTPGPVATPVPLPPPIFTPQPGGVALPPIPIPPILTVTPTVPPPITAGRINSILVPIYSAVGTLVAMAAVAGVSPDTTATIVSSIHEIGDGVLKIAGGLASLIPIVMSGLVFIRTSLPSLLKAVAPQVKTVLVSDPALAASIPAANVKVVSPLLQLAVDQHIEPLKDVSKP
jgi:hypothetical protein